MHKFWTWSNCKVLALTLFAALALTVTAFAQIDTGSFTGTVEDPSGAVIPGAAITVTNQGTNRSVSAQTGSSGAYRVQSLSPGLYTIKAEAKGFKTAVNKDLELTVGAVQRVDFRMELGQATQTVTVEGAAPLVNTEEGRLSHLISGAEVANLPLNGRNIFDLMQIAPGAVNVDSVMFENGANTVVNGLRENFNGFWMDGVANKGLSGGFVTQPNQDIVQEFRISTLNMSAEYGNSAGSVTTLVTKSGGNAFHGSAYDFLRNDAMDANEFFRNQAGCELGVEPLCNGPARGDGKGNLAKTPLRFNQFGITGGGPIRKDKTFFFASYQGARTKTFAPAVPITLESADWRQAVISALPNSTAALLYQNFPGPAGSVISTVDSFVGDNYGGFDYLLCPDNFGASTSRENDMANRTAASFQSLFGVTASDAAACATAIPMGQTPTQLANRTLPFQVSGVALIGSQSVGNLFNGDEWSVRIDHNIREKDRLFGRFYQQKQTDKFGPSNVTSLRGFQNPQVYTFPNFAIAWTHSFGGTIVNELRGGFTRNDTNIAVKVAPGVPAVGFDTGDVGFGSYNGYPQFFHENIYSYQDLLTITKGKHGIKMGVEFRRNIENSEFNVARPSDYFFDHLFFAADAPYDEAAGVDPGIISNRPAQLNTSNRAWRNIEMGAFFQDDWKVKPHLTLNLGLRYDLYKRHVEKFGRMTQFILGDGANITERMRNANTPAGLPGCDTPAQIAQAQIAGVCGAGGFAAAKALGEGDHNNFGPRFGFAWDPKGSGKTSIRGGFGVSYEGTLYNPLSNSRWNLPFYSFNDATNFLGGDVSWIVYGPQTYDANGQVVIDPSQTPTFDGAGTNPGQGAGAQAFGNLVGWDPSNANLAFLTAIVPSKGFRDPYVYSFFFGIQKELLPSTVLEVNYVGSAGHKLYRAQQINRVRGGRLPIPGTCLDTYVSGGDPGICSNRSSVNAVGRVNPNYGTMRQWQNAVNSNYHSLQISLNKKMSHGLGLTANYTWGHSIDAGSDWHSGATSANGAAAGDGYNFDIQHPELDRGHSTFDIRQRFIVSQVWELPWKKSQQGFVGHVLGGWQLNSVWIFQSGAHWTAYEPRSRRLRCLIGGVDSGSANAGGGASACLAAGGEIINTNGDFNLDAVSNDRVDSVGPNSIAASKDQYANGYFNGENAYTAGFVAKPCLACNGSMARNTMVGPGRFQTDLSFFKNIKVTEKVMLQFRSELFNAWNRANFKLPSSSTGSNGANRVNSPIFGEAAGAFDPRQIQFALKLLW